MENLKVAIVQSDIIWEDAQANMDHLSELLNQHIKEQVHLIILPEMFTTGFSMKVKELATSMDSKELEWMAIQAQNFNCSIAGSIIIKEDKRVYNRLIFQHPEQSNQYYDKRHLFRMSGEDQHYAQGDSKIICSINNWNIQPMICYDLRFPVWSRNKNEYEVLIYVANWPKPRKEVWKTLLKARAIENQAYVIGVNRVGQDGMGLQYSGDSMLISPKGEVLSKNNQETEFVEICELSLRSLNDFKAKFPAYLDADQFSIDLD